jgi:hypothetical protein
VLDHVACTHCLIRCLPPTTSVDILVASEVGAELTGQVRGAIQRLQLTTDKVRRQSIDDGDALRSLEAAVAAAAAASSAVPVPALPLQQPHAPPRPPRLKTSSSVLMSDVALASYARSGSVTALHPDAAPLEASPAVNPRPRLDLGPPAFSPSGASELDSGSALGSPAVASVAYRAASLSSPASPFGHHAGFGGGGGDGLFRPTTPAAAAAAATAPAIPRHAFTEGRRGKVVVSPRIDRHSHQHESAAARAPLQKTGSEVALAVAESLASAAHTDMQVGWRSS